MKRAQTKEAQGSTLWRPLFSFDLSLNFWWKTILKSLEKWLVYECDKIKWRSGTFVLFLFLFVNSSSLVINSFMKPHPFPTKLICFFLLIPLHTISVGPTLIFSFIIIIIQLPKPNHDEAWTFLVSWDFGSALSHLFLIRSWLSSRPLCCWPCLRYLPFYITLLSFPFIYVYKLENKTPIIPAPYFLNMFFFFIKIIWFDPFLSFICLISFLNPTP